MWPRPTSGLLCRWMPLPDPDMASGFPHSKALPSYLPCQPVSAVAQSVVDFRSYSSSVKEAFSHSPFVKHALSHSHCDMSPDPHLQAICSPLAWAAVMCPSLVFPALSMSLKKKKHKQLCWHTGRVSTNLALTMPRVSTSYWLFFSQQCNACQVPGNLGSCQQLGLC